MTDDQRSPSKEQADGSDGNDDSETTTGAELGSSESTSRADVGRGETENSSDGTDVSRTNVRPVDPQEVLDTVMYLGIDRWQYTGEGDFDHMGPTPEEFHTQFDLGNDDSHISNHNAEGVLFAAVQGLAERLADKEQRIQMQADRIEALERRLTQMESRHGTKVTSTDR